MDVVCGVARTVRLTGATPENPSWLAPAAVRSITRPGTNGPRSLMRTVIERPLFVCVTCTMVPKGKLRCAAVSVSDFSGSPFAVSSPLYAPLYNDAMPDSAKAADASAARKNPKSY